MKIRSAGAELFHAEKQTNRQTDLTKLMVAFLLRKRLTITEEITEIL
jgi:hypothetical protein